jgi:hypothetical protein
VIPSASKRKWRAGSSYGPLMIGFAMTRSPTGPTLAGSPDRCAGHLGTRDLGTKGSRGESSQPWP